MAYGIMCKLNNPVVHNRGTEYEKTCDTFLEKVCYTNRETAQAQYDKMNATAIDCEYFIDEIEID